MTFYPFHQQYIHFRISLKLECTQVSWYLKYILSVELVLQYCMYIGTFNLDEIQEHIHNPKPMIIWMSWLQSILQQNISCIFFMIFCLIRLNMYLRTWVEEQGVTTRWRVISLTPTGDFFLFHPLFSICLSWEFSFFVLYIAGRYWFYSFHIPHGHILYFAPLSRRQNTYDGHVAWYSRRPL